MRGPKPIDATHTARVKGSGNALFWLKKVGDRYLIWQYASSTWGTGKWRVNNFTNISPV